MWRCDCWQIHRTFRNRENEATHLTGTSSRPMSDQVATFLESLRLPVLNAHCPMIRECRRQLPRLRNIMRRLHVEIESFLEKLPWPIALHSLDAPWHQRLRKGVGQVVRHRMVYEACVPMRKLLLHARRPAHGRQHLKSTSDQKSPDCIGKRNLTDPEQQSRRWHPLRPHS